MRKYLSKIVILAIVLILALVTLSGCQKEEKNTNSTNSTNTISSELEGLKVYKYQKYDGYVVYRGDVDVKFSYPVTWMDINPNDTKNPVLKSTSATGESVNVRSYTTDLNLETLVEEATKGVKESITVIGDISKENINLNGRKACRVDYVISQKETTTENPEGVDVEFRIVQIVFIQDTKAYIMTCMVHNSDYDKVKDTFENIINTFRR